MVPGPDGPQRPGVVGDVGNSAGGTVAATEREFDALFDELYPSVYRYCRRMAGDEDAAEDAAQEAFVRLLERPVEGDRNGIRSWLFKVARHVLRDRARVTDNRDRILAENPHRHEGRPTEGDPPDRELERNENRRTVRAALDELSERDRSLLLLREEGFSYQELASELGVAAGSVGTLLARARRRFEASLRRCGGPEYGGVDDPS